MNAWDKTESKPNDERFVILLLEDGIEVEAQYKEARSNLFRAGKQWIDRNGKFRAVSMNPAISWTEI